jgi:UPF0716 protein FxsA
VIGKLALLFTTVTLLELSLLIPLGQAIGLPATIAIVIVTAVVGATLAKRQGITIWNRIQKELGSGKLPRDSLLDGLADLIAGAFFLTPGVLTDAVGILLLIPPVRAPVKALVKRYAKKMLESPDVTYVQMGNGEVEMGNPEQPSMSSPSPASSSATADREDDVIDVEPVDSETADTTPEPDTAPQANDDQPDSEQDLESERDFENDNRVDVIGNPSTSRD